MWLSGGSVVLQAALPETVGMRLSAPLRAQGAVRVLAIAVVLGGLYALGALLPFWFLSSPEEGAAFFPAAGLTVAVLALTPKRLWPLWLAVIAAAELAVDLSHEQTFRMTVGFTLANTLEPLVGAVVLTWAVRRWRASIHHIVLVGLIGGAVVLGPMVGGLFGGTTALLADHHSPWASVVGSWWLGDGLGVLVVATPILAGSVRSRFEPQGRPLVVAMLVVAAAAITIVPAVTWHNPIVYAVLP